MTHPSLSSILRINRHRIHAIHTKLQPYGYVGVMHLIILYLNRHPGSSQDDIACFYSTDKGSVARDARRLEDLKHIRREVDPENRRQYQLYLTDEGLKMRDMILEVYDDFYRQMTRDLSPEERSALEALLARVEQNVCNS